MHNKKFFITWLDKKECLFSEEVTGLSGIIAQLWLIYEDSRFAFDTIHIKVISDN